MAIKFKGKKKSAKYWIAGAIKHPGALRAQLGVKGEGPIPASKLRSAAGKSGKLGFRARMAITLRRLAQRRKG